MDLLFFNYLYKKKTNYNEAYTKGRVL